MKINDTSAQDSVIASAKSVKTYTQFPLLLLFFIIALIVFYTGFSPWSDYSMSVLAERMFLGATRLVALTQC